MDYSHIRIVTKVVLHKNRPKWVIYENLVIIISKSGKDKNEILFKTVLTVINAPDGCISPFTKTHNEA